jgi:hypothetical protein
VRAERGFILYGVATETVRRTLMQRDLMADVSDATLSPEDKAVIRKWLK